MFNLGTEIEKLVLADLDKTTQIDKVPTDLKPYLNFIDRFQLNLCLN